MIKVGFSFYDISKQLENRIEEVNLRISAKKKELDIDEDKDENNENSNDDEQ